MCHLWTCKMPRCSGETRSLGRENLAPIGQSRPDFDFVFKVNNQEALHFVPFLLGSGPVRCSCETSSFQSMPCPLPNEEKTTPNIFPGLLPESQGQDPALTSLYVPCSLDSGLVLTFCMSVNMYARRWTQTWVWGIWVLKGFTERSGWGSPGDSRLGIEV